MKRCPRCGQAKDESLFGKNKGVKVGLHAYCKECKNESMKEYRLRHPDVDKKYSVKWAEKYPKSGAAHIKLNRKIKSGEIIKPKICIKCNKEEELVGHHPYCRYDKPLDVIWLCKSCHKYIHQEEKGFTRHNL
jgi:hypothetical protein